MIQAGARMGVKSEMRTHVRDLLGQRSGKVKDRSGRDVEILDDAEAEKLADECGCSVLDVFIEALTQGVCPYRYLRNGGIISYKEQLHLAKSRVAVIGAGGLGGHVILLLARLGIGHLVIVDYDTFDESNLNRQALSNRMSLGRSKSEEAVAVVDSINPGVEAISLQVRLDAGNMVDILTGSDVVVDALDNIPDRFLIERAAGKLGIPLIHGALAGFEGRLMTIFPDDPGLEYLYGNADVTGNNSKSPESILGIPALAPSLIATLQAMEVIKIILKRGKVFRNVMVNVDLETGRMEKFVFKNPELGLP